jgi:exodeoxyribonuclease (lambda-induced)
MKSLSEINDLLGKFEKKFGISALGADQQSDAWFTMKLGVLSASNASKIVAKKDSETRFTYLCELVAQICTGIHHEISGPALAWGNDNEDKARAFYEFQSGHTITQVPFVFKDDSFREGCSPDGLIESRMGVEIKCPFASSNYIKFLLEDSVKPEWKWQYQYLMRVLDAKEWEFTQYDPRMRVKPRHILRVSYDEKMQNTLNDAVPQFIDDMDQALEKIGIEFGSQWKV